MGHDHLIDGISTTHALIAGFIFSVGTVVAANIQPHVDILDWIAFSIGYVDFPIRSILTILGGFSGLAIAILGIRKALHPQKLKDELAEVIAEKLGD